MSEFKLVQRATFQPTKCALCGAHEGPFVDTEVDLVPFGHLYICASTERRAGCVRQMARKDGTVSVEELDEVRAERDWLLEEIKRLESERMVSIDDLRTVVSEALSERMLQEV